MYNFDFHKNGPELFRIMGQVYAENNANELNYTLYITSVRTGLTALQNVADELVSKR